MSRVVLLFVILLVVVPFITASDDANEVMAKFKAAREQRQKQKQGTSKTAMVVPESKAGDNDFETRRAALLAQAEENIPAERDLEWEKQLQEDRRSLYFDRDRSIMDETNNNNNNDDRHMAGIHPPEL